MRALVIGSIVPANLLIPNLLVRTGFEVDCVTSARRPRRYGLITRIIRAQSASDLPRVAATASMENVYALIVAVDDHIIRLVLDSELDEAEKLRLLPVVAPENFVHLSSKIGFSLVLEAASIRTPAFRIIHNKGDLANHAAELKLPLILKGDFSMGGRQTILCETERDLQLAIETVDFYPAILQRYVSGNLIAIEAFYQKARLVRFSYCEMLKNENDQRFGPSSLRQYTQIGSLETKIPAELSALGLALGAHGFANIACIRSHVDREHYYFEADLRPNAWVNHPRFFGDDPARYIRTFFIDGTVMEKLPPVNALHPEQILMPYLPRLHIWEIIFNRYGAWKYLREDSLAFRAFLRKLRHGALSILNLRLFRRLVGRVMKDKHEGSPST
jgi:hypothetical protein